MGISHPLPAQVYEASKDAIVAAVHDRPYVFELFNRAWDDEELPSLPGRGGYLIDYLDMLAKSVFVLCPAGDAYVTGCLTESLEMGAIPIAENPRDFKGCASPMGFYEALDLRLTVRNWHELPEVLAYHFDRDDVDDHLMKLHDQVMAWNLAWKRSVADSIVDFRRAMTEGPVPENTCARVELTTAEADQLDRDFEAYYAHEHWFDNYRDSVWDPGGWCSKFEDGPSDTDDTDDPYFGIRGHGCFDAKCAPPSVAAFVCDDAADAGAAQLRRWRSASAAPKGQQSPT